MPATALALFLSFAVASAGPTPSDIEQLVCQLATNKQVEDKAVGSICATISAKFPTVHFNPDCVTALESIWDRVATKFPRDCKGLPTPPTPADIGKLVCKVATKKMIEERSVDSVCGLINRTVPNAKFNPDCKSVIEGAWDLIAFECPKGQEAAMATLPTPADIEKLVCELASQKMIEDRTTDAVCSLINKTFPDVKFNPDCKTLLEGAWDIVLSKCPKGNEALPSPADIEKLVCEVASQKMIEERATDSVCSLINRTFPDVKFNPDCKTLLEGVWDIVLSKCPKSNEAFPSPGDIEKLVCEVASQKMIEKRATDAVCSLINKTFPDVKLNPACKTLLEGAWDIVLSKCPKGNEALPSPADIEKLVCEVASQKMIEERATDVVCSLINKTFPDVKLKPDCKTLLEGAWDIVLSKCPKGNVALPSPGDIEKLVCGEVTKPVVQQRVTRAICTEVHLPNCERAVGTAFKAVADECHSPVPLPDELEKIACQLANNKGMEDKATKAVCKFIHSQHPEVPAWACTLTLKQKWQALEAHCPKEVILV